MHFVTEFEGIPEKYGKSQFSKEMLKNINKFVLGSEF